MTSDGRSRQEQKERTREALLAGALRLSLEVGFAQVSLRQVTRDAGIVPTAFYRHFTSVDELGLDLVRRAFATLRRMVREVQEGLPDPGDLIDASADVLVSAVRQDREYFAFVARERFGGSVLVRTAIRRELDLFVSELAVALAQLPVYRSWSADDIRLAAGLFVRNLVSRAEEVIELPANRPDLLEEIKQQARREMRMMVVGMAGWRS